MGLWGKGVSGCIYLKKLFIRGISILNGVMSLVDYIGCVLCSLVMDIRVLVVLCGFGFRFGLRWGCFVVLVVLVCLFGGFWCFMVWLKV